MNLPASMGSAHPLSRALAKLGDGIATGFVALGPEIPTVGIRVLEFQIQERIASSFRVQLRLSATLPTAIDLNAALDTPVALAIYNQHQGLRWFHGLISAAERHDAGRWRAEYQLTLEPQIYRLMHGADCRIWQNKTVPDIVAEVLAQYGVDHLRWQLSANYQPREYCVQYRENHLAFIERLLFEEGIYYYFEHHEDKHIMVLTDAPYQATAQPGVSTLRYNAIGGGQAREGYIDHFTLRERVKSTVLAQRDYSFKKPHYDQYQESHGRPENGGSQHIWYDYPGRYKGSATGKPYTEARMQAMRVDATTGSGHSNSIYLQSGHCFMLEEHDHQSYNQSYRLLSVEHRGQQPTALGADGGEAPTTYDVSFTVQPAQHPYRATANHRPKVDGPQICKVVGPPGEEIYCDEHGRVKVKFPWDWQYQSGARPDEDSSCWVRVAQGWAGGSYGMMAIPRIGHEVIVDFLEGDPDQPIITGRTYNAATKPPYALPANKTRTVIKTDTHKGSGSNEIRFEDLADQEEIYIHAQKDQNNVVENNETTQVGVDRSENVGNNETIGIGNDRSETVGNDESISIGHDRTESVGHDERVNIGNDRYKQIARNEQAQYGKDHIHAVGNIYKQKIGADHLYEVGRDYKGQVNGKFKLDVGGSITNNTAKHTLTAFETFVIAGPGGKITLDSSGITLEAGKINLKGAVSMGGSGGAQVPTLSLAATEGLPLCEECEKAKKGG